MSKSQLIAKFKKKEVMLHAIKKKINEIYVRFLPELLHKERSPLQ